MASPNLPPPARNGSTRPATSAATAQVVIDPSKFTISDGLIEGPQKVLLYGTGGIGKSTLASLAPDPVFVDIERGTGHMNVRRVDNVETFADLRSCLQSDLFSKAQTVVLDSATKAEEWAVAHTLATVAHEKGHRVSSIEGYGFGKGKQYVYDTFLLLMADMDSLVRRGFNVILLAHDCVVDVPNPASDNFIRYEPHLQNPKSGASSIRNRVVQWADYVLYLGYDVISKDGKGHGAGTRTIWTSERPSHIAKSRTALDEIPFENATDGTIWSLIFGGK